MQVVYPYRLLCIQWFWFFVMEVSSYEGERTFCFRVSKLAFCSSPLYIFSHHLVLAETIKHLLSMYVELSMTPFSALKPPPRKVTNEK